MSDLKDLKLSELRELYPDIKAASVAKFIEKVEALKDNDNTPTVGEVSGVDDNDGSTSVEDAIKIVSDSARGRKKILLVTEDKVDADDLILTIQNEVFPELEKKEVLISLNTRMRYMHLNGSCFVRVSCKNRYKAVETTASFTDVIFVG